MNALADESDEDLMLAYAAGDASAFARLYDFEIPADALERSGAP